MEWRTRLSDNIILDVSKVEFFMSFDNLVGSRISSSALVICILFWQEANIKALYDSKLTDTLNFHFLIYLLGYPPFKFPIHWYAILFFPLGIKKKPSLKLYYQIFHNIIRWEYLIFFLRFLSWEESNFLIMEVLNSIKRRPFRISKKFIDGHE